MPYPVLNHLRPGGDDLYGGVEDIANGDVAGRLAAVVADLYNVAYFLTPTHGLLQGRLVHGKLCPVEDLSVNAA